MEKTLNFIESKIDNFCPEIALVLGSGLGSFADDNMGIAISYEKIPKFEKSTVKGHKGQLVFSKVKGKNVVMMQGRYHYYEGYAMDSIIYPIKILKKLGVKTIILTNAAGLVNKNFNVGDLMFITDHINMFGVDPLCGINDATLGTRFPDMSEVYNKELITLGISTAKALNISIQSGIYYGRTGPSYETPAEINMIRTLGADAVGMSTVPEAICANYCSMKVLGISCLTNYAAGIIQKPLNHTEVVETAAKVQNDFKKLLINLIEQL